ncbi:BCCT family transporter [Saccharopolyspora rectivirgula]
MELLERSDKKPEPTSTKLVDQPGRMDWVVFGISAIAAVAFIAWGVLGTESLQSFASTALEVLVRDGGWVFTLAGTAFVVFALWLAFSKYGRIPLGEDDERPEFRTSSWIAMMFAAGMGIGLMFYGVSEPLTHFTSPPPGSVEAGTDAALGTAMATSLFHWTLHPWAIYSVVGLAIAYASYRRGRKQLISSAFVPFFGKRASESPVGRIIDALAVFATVFGTAASLGIGATQIAAGLTQVGWVDSVGNTLLVGIITVLIVTFMISAVSGVSKGIQLLSNSNMLLALLLAVFLFFVGPTVFILDLLPLSAGSYLSEFGEMISRTGAVGGEEMQSWLSSWTIFYWAWWIAWAPFVGMFIARISRGRTIRQFIGGVLLVPSVISLVWFAILGGTALHQERSGAGLADAGGAEEQLFEVFRNLPLTGVASVLAMLLIINFFVTSADSASVVLGSMSQRGSANPNKFVVVFWGVVIGGVAIVMLLTGGEDALSGLNNTTIIAASPFVVVVLAMCMALVKDLRSDPMVLREAKGAEVLEQAVIIGNEEHDGEFQLVTEPVENNGTESEGEPGDSGR